MNGERRGAQGQKAKSYLESETEFVTEFCRRFSVLKKVPVPSKYIGTLSNQDGNASQN